VRLIDEADLDDLATGSAILGAGGGGDPYVGKLIAREAIRAHGPVRLLDVTEVADDATAAYSFLVGAPSVGVEKHPRTPDLVAAVHALERRIGRRITHLLSIEAGGLNSVVPVSTAAVLGLPLIDADGMGRAFPSVAMVTSGLHDVTGAPMTMADERGSVVTIEQPSNRMLEHIARAVTVAMGASAACAGYVMTGRQVRETTVHRTMTLAQDLGRAVREARSREGSATRAILERQGGRTLMEGKIVSVDRRTERGFTLGSYHVDGTGPDQGGQLVVQFQNENLIALRDGAAVTTVPDLIMSLDAATGLPIPTESLRYGLRVIVVGMPCDSQWRTPAGLAVVGPREFGYDMEYVPVETLTGPQNARREQR
jgi:uncharacterized protein